MRLKVFASVFIAVLFLILGLNVYASDDTSTSSSTPTTKSTRTPLQQKIDIKQRIKTLKTTISQNRETFFEFIQQKRKEASEAASAQRQAFKKRLAQIRDERKKEIVERMNDKLVAFNKKHTERFAQVLDKLEELFDRIKKKVETAKAEGKDITAVETAIQQAQTAIDDAKKALSTQAGKEYIIQITDENSLKNTVGKTVSQFRQDLKSTHKVVVDARQAVHNAAKELAKLIGLSGIRPSKSATQSGGTQ